MVLGGSFHFGNSQTGHTSGEDIWARSSVDALTELNHTILYSYDTLETKVIHDALGELINTIFMEGSNLDECVGWGVPIKLDPNEAASGNFMTMTYSRAKRYRHENGLPSIAEESDDGSRWGWKKLSSDEARLENGIGCIKRQGNPDGIPIWKMHTFHFWDSPAHVLGPQWTLSPEDYGSHSHRTNSNPSNVYLGYSVEKYCKRHPIPSKFDRGFIFAKNPDYFAPGAFAFHTHDNRTFANIKEELGMDFVATAGNREDVLPDPGVENLGRMPPDEWYQELAKSVALVGIGRPWISPTPYDALCREWRRTRQCASRKS